MFLDLRWFYKLSLPLRGPFGDAAKLTETCSICICSNQWEGCGQRLGTHEGMRTGPRWPWGSPCRKGVCSDGSAGPRCGVGSLRTRPRSPRRWPGTRSCQSDSGQSGRYSYKLGKERNYWQTHPVWGTASLASHTRIPASSPPLPSATPPSLDTRIQTVKLGLSEVFPGLLLCSDSLSEMCSQNV